jgi:mono/diheme cytochrome c family protein
VIGITAWGSRRCYLPATFDKTDFRRQPSIVEKAMNSISSWLLLILLIFPAYCFADPPDASALYKSKCTVCHGTDGTGDTPMGKKLGSKSFKSPEVQKESDSDLKNIISSGKGKMPAYKTLAPEQIDALVKYVRELGK